MPNENCLKGMKCPECGSFGPYKIASSCWAVWTDEGTENYTELEFGDEDRCICLDCKNNGTVKVFEDAGDYGEVETLCCCGCGKDVPVEEAHLHQGDYFGDCCWDERLRATE